MIPVGGTGVLERVRTSLQEFMPSGLFNFLGPDCVVAGGAIVRAMARQPRGKDIDVFITRDCWSGHARDIQGWLGPRANNIQSSDNPSRFVYTSFASKTLIDVIVTDTSIEETLTNFDIRMCGVCFDGKRLLAPTQWVIDDLRNGRIHTDNKPVGSTLTQIEKYTGILLAAGIHAIGSDMVGSPLVQLVARLPSMTADELRDVLNRDRRKEALNAVTNEFRRRKCDDIPF